MDSKKRAFTLIELLVVIAIIGILATISVIALQNARAKSRDAKRVADVKQVQTALELFFNDEGRYPTAAEFNSGSLFSTSTGATTTYMAQIPAAPVPADGSCTTANNSYSYSVPEDGGSYSLSFCLGGSTGVLTSGLACATSGGLANVDCTPLPPFSPSDVSGLSLWLKADTGITKDSSDYVSAWADQSGNNNPALQPTLSNEPLLISNQLNGKPVLRFDGSNDYLSFSTISSVRSIFVVGKHRTGTQSGYASWLGNTVAYDFVGDAGTNLISRTWTSTNVQNGQVYINGGVVGTTYAKKPTSYSIVSYLPLGNIPLNELASDRNTYYWDGDIAEVVLYDRELEQSEKQEVEQYLSDKYNIPIHKTLIPLMTSNTTPSGIVSASSVLSGREPYGALDGKNEQEYGRWVSAAAGNQWFKYKFPSVQIVTGYRFVSPTMVSNIYPSAWVIEGSNDDTTWAILDSRSGITFSALEEDQTFSFSNQTPYLYYRFSFSASGGGSYYDITKIELY